MNTDYSYCSGVTCSIRKSCKRYLPDPPDTRLQWVWPAYNPGTDKCKVKATGEVIDVEPSGTMQVLCGSFITKDGRRMPGTALEFEKAIDWEQRRYEIAKEIMKGFSANSHNQCVDASSETLAQWSISGADALIAELKKGGKG